MKKTITSMMAFMTIILFSTMSFGQDAQIWKKYIGTISDPNIPVLPNYGYAGYKQGQEAIPDTHNLTTFDVTNYGAVANDNNSDQAAIQAAIDAAEANGGGIVFFPPGEFLINTNANSTNSIMINGSNIVLKGSGSTPGGTVINMVNHMLQPSGGNPWDTPQMIRFIGGSSNTGSTNIIQDQNRGDFTVKVQNASIFQNKKYLKLEMDNNTAANNYFLEGKTPRSIWTKVINDGVEVSEFHEIASVNTSSNTITLKDPILDDIESSWGWKAHTVNLIENCGFEDIHFKGNFNDPFQHHKDYIHDYAWHAVYMRLAANSWVRRSKFSNVSMAAKFNAVYASNIMTILIEGNAGHGVSAVDGGSTGVLQGLIWDNTNNGQWHGPDMSGRTCGSVVWRVETAGRGWDLHSAQPRTNLIDLYSSDGISGSGGHYSNNPNHLSGLTIWNQERTGGNETNYNFWNTNCGSNYCGTTVANPIIVGYHGSATTTFNQSSVKYEESNGTIVSPASLYEAQVEHRSGSKPAWINAAINEYNNLKSDWYNGSGGNNGGGSETFSNMTLSGWGTETYTGDNGISWTVNGKGVTGFINSSKGVYFQKDATGIQSGTIPGGISSFSISCKDLWDEGVERTLQLLINDNVVDTFTHTGTSVYTCSVNNINISGDITIAVKNASITGGDRTVAFDDITWSGYASTVAVTGVNVTPSSISLEEGETTTLIETISPNDASDKSVSWSSSNTAVATVSSNGLVTAIASGTATITATTTDGGFIDNSIVTITSAPSGLTNLALNKPVTASSEPEPANSASNAVDGNTSSRWSATGFPQWLEVDLGGLKSISKTELVCFSDRAYQFVIESKTTVGGSYTQIVNRTSNTTGGSVANPITDNFSALDARYVRITVSGASGYTGSWVSLIEFRVFGEDAGTGTTPTTVTLSAINDAYLQGTTNFNSNVLKIQQTGTIRIGYLMFDLSGVNGTITNAELQMTCHGDGSGSAMNIKIDEGNSSNWNETNLSDANKPSATDALGSRNGSWNVGTRYTWDLDETKISGGSNLSLLVSSTSGGSDAWFASDENSVTGPELVVTYSASSAKQTQPSKPEALLEEVPIEEEAFISMYPNPLHNRDLNISLFNDVDSDVRIYDIRGQLIVERKQVRDQLILSNRLFNAKGMYFVRVESGNGNINKTMKLIVR